MEGGHLGDLTRTQKNSTEMEFREMGCGDVNQTEVIWDCVQWWGLVVSSTYIITTLFRVGFRPFIYQGTTSHKGACMKSCMKPLGQSQQST